MRAWEPCHAQTQQQAGQLDAHLLLLVRGTAAMTVLRGVGLVLVGAVVLSRLPLTNSSRFMLNEQSWYCQRVCLEWAGRPLTMFNVHLRRPELNLSLSE